MNTLKISGLIATHAVESASNLDQALASLSRQKYLDECILVLDGPVTDEQIAVIDRHRQSELALRVLRLRRNQGLAAALNVGLRACRGDWVARLDSDDVSLAHRLATQWRFVMEHCDVDCVSSWSVEFDPAGLTRPSVKKTPGTHQEIIG